MKLTKKQKVRVANFTGSTGTSGLSPVEEQLVKKGVFKAREGFMVSLSWGDGWEEKGAAIRRELAEEIRPKLSDDAVEALLERQFHPELPKHNLGYERKPNHCGWTLMRLELGAEVVRIVEEERA